MCQCILVGTYPRQHRQYITFSIKKANCQIFNSSQLQRTTKENPMGSMCASLRSRSHTQSHTHSISDNHNHILYIWYYVYMLYPRSNIKILNIKIEPFLHRQSRRWTVYVGQWPYLREDILFRILEPGTAKSASSQDKTHNSNCAEPYSNEQLGGMLSPQGEPERR